MSGWGWKAWSKPFVILGLNAIALFVMSGLGTQFLINHRTTGPDGKSITWLKYAYTTWVEPVASPYHASLLFALANLAALFVILYVMYRRNIFLKA